jgi:hypothetical protein
MSLTPSHITFEKICYHLVTATGLLHVNMKVKLPERCTKRHCKKQSHYRPEYEGEAPRFHDNRHMKVVRLSALQTGRLHPHELFLVLIYVGARGGAVIEALRYKQESRGFDSQ